MKNKKLTEKLVTVLRCADADLQGIEQRMFDGPSQDDIKAASKTRDEIKPVLNALTTVAAVDLTEETEAKFGAIIAEIFCLKKDRKNKDRFVTGWGTKTPLGLCRMFLRIAEEIQDGTLKK